MSEMTRDNWDWQEFLTKAQAGKADFSEKDLARALAGCWDTCACGELYSLTGKGRVNKDRMDVEMYKLGLRFDGLLYIGRYYEAETILHAIWDREAELTKQVFAGMGTAAAVERKAEAEVLV